MINCYSHLLTNNSKMMNSASISLEFVEEDESKLDVNEENIKGNIILPIPNQIKKLIK